ncbi:hypothetical protein N7540_008338 [Penicillium herquei]|nr:hypothetical protein N7540_008338 [Penicillium herquei]
MASTNEPVPATDVSSPLAHYFGDLLRTTYTCWCLGAVKNAAAQSSRWVGGSCGVTAHCVFCGYAFSPASSLRDFGIPTTCSDFFCGA